MLIGNYILGWWGDNIQLDGATAEGWLAGAFDFWMLPALLAIAILIFFVLTFKGDEKHETVDQQAWNPA